MALERKYEKYTVEEKEKLATLAEKYKAEYLQEAKELEKNKVWDRRRKKYVAPKSESMKDGFLVRAVKCRPTLLFRPALLLGSLE